MQVATDHHEFPIHSVKCTLPNIIKSYSNDGAIDLSEIINTLNSSNVFAIICTMISHKNMEGGMLVTPMAYGTFSPIYKNIMEQQAPKNVGRITRFLLMTLVLVGCSYMLVDIFLIMDGF